MLYSFHPFTLNVTVSLLFEACFLLAAFINFGNFSLSIGAGKPCIRNIIIDTVGLNILLILFISFFFLTFSLFSCIFWILSIFFSTLSLWAVLHFIFSWLLWVSQTVSLTYHKLYYATPRWCGVLEQSAGVSPHPVLYVIDFTSVLHMF